MLHVCCVGSREKSTPPTIEEYKVGPLPAVSSHELISDPEWKRAIPYNYRLFYSDLDIGRMIVTLERELGRINHILLELTGYSFGNCTDNCLVFEPGVPAQWTSPQTRNMFLVLLRALPGHFLHPVGLQVRLDMHSNNHSDWSVDILWFRGTVYFGIDDFLSNFDQTQQRENPPSYDPTDRNLYSSLNFRGDPLPREPKRGPRSYMPDGKRFSVNRHQVSWQGWWFDFNVRSDIGIQLHDVQFKGDRIAYELSLSEIGVIYSGASPSPQHTSYLDSTWPLGMFFQELFQQVDCPENAQYFDFAHYMQTNVIMNRRSICLYEMDQGVPLRRMYSPDFMGSYHYFQGMPSNVLVLRSIISLGNYAYIIDFIFHQHGAIEVKTSLDGFIMSTYYTEAPGDKFGFQVAPDSLGQIHNHLLHYKVDLDILGPSNRFETLEIATETIRDTTENNPVEMIVQVFNRSLKRTEMEAALKYNFDNPKYYLMYNNEHNNSYSNPRAYRILPVSMSKNILPEGWMIENGYDWARYQVGLFGYDLEENVKCSV